MRVTATSKCPLGIKDLSVLMELEEGLNWNCIGNRCTYYKDSTCSKQAKPNEKPVNFGLSKRVRVKK